MSCEHPTGKSVDLVIFIQFNGADPAFALSMVSPDASTAIDGEKRIEMKEVPELSLPRNREKSPKLVEQRR
jgi:hypothetical protein